MAEPHNTTVWAFVRAVGKHWVTLMSGGVITVAVAIYERWSTRNVPIWVYAAILVGFAFSACYLAWRDSCRRYSQAEEKLTEIERHKLIFEIDLRATTVRVEQTNTALRIFAIIQLWFENRDIHPIAMKELKVFLRRGHTEIFTWWFPRITSNGIEIKQEDFDGMMVQAGRVTPFYRLEVVLAIESEEIKRAADLTIGDFLLLTMQSGGHQPELSAKLHPYWEGAIKEKGTGQITVTGVKSIPVDYRRM